MRSRTFAAVVAAAVLLTTGCDDRSTREKATLETTASSPATHVTPSPTPPRDAQPIPGPGAPIASDPDDLTEEIATVERTIRRRVREHIESGARPGSPEGEELELFALYQQRIFRKLTKNERLEKAVLARLEGKVRKFYAGTIAAQEELASITGTSKKVPRFEFAKAETPHRLRRYFEEGERRFRIPWHMLAAVMFVESKFGKVLGPSVAGALGPMQFLPSTWDAYGGGGDIMDPHDSVIGAARYLNASGGPERMRDALFAYNPTEPYVNAIQIYARQIKRDEENFYMYYFWQVFVSTEKEGDVQLTGPGTRRDLT
jgi:hypothetical protein